MRRFLTGWLVCALLCTLCACENAAGQADLQSIQKADVRELYEALYSDVAEAEDTYVGKTYAFLGAVKSLSSGHGVIALKDFRDHVTYGNGIRAHFSKQTLGELRCDEMVWIAGTIAGFSCEDGTILLDPAYYIETPVFTVTGRISALARDQAGRPYVLLEQAEVSELGEEMTVAVFLPEEACGAWKEGDQMQVTGAMSWKGAPGVALSDGYFYRAVLAEK